MLRALLILAFLLPGGFSLASPQDDVVKRLYESGVDLLRAGKNLDKAIQHLETVVRREPENADHQNALACAYASRFASVSVAVKLAERYETDARFYEKLKKEWNDDQQDPEGRMRGWPEPVGPAAPTTLDDGQPFTLKPYFARLEMLRLGHRALATFDKARELAEKRPKAEKIKLDYARGWGLFLLRHFGEPFVLDAKLPPKPGVSAADVDPLAIHPKEVVNCFQRCAETGPKDPDLLLYRYSLALAHAPKLLGWAAFLGGSPEQPLHREAQIKAAAAELDKLLAVQSSHRGALYALGLLYRESQPGAAAEYLEKAAKRGPDNAVAWYQAAEARFQQAEEQTEQKKDDEARKTAGLALELVERGNRAPRYQAIRIDIPAPALLRKAWELAEAYGIPDGYMAVNLGGSVMLAARDAASRGDLQKALAAYRLQCDFGRMVMGAMAGADIDTRLPNTQHIPKLRRQFGALHYMVGYKEMDALNQKQPDALVSAFLAANAADFERAKALEKVPY